MISARQASYVLLLIDAVLCSAIILRVNYTEIDWRAYMQQVEQFLAGERDYALIKGDTGPLVYPAGHVYFYTGLHYLTHNGASIITAQVIFAGIYLATLGTTMATYRVVKAPLKILPLLILSRRMHANYMLRLFNDGVSTFFMSVSTLCYTRAQYFIGSTFFALSLAIKMNALLYVPAVIMILVQGTGVMSTIKHGAWILQIQLLLGSPFLTSHAYNYLARAFDLTRVFEYKWTVNWRFVPSETFYSSGFAQSLLLAHLSLVVWFASTRWNRPSRKSLVALVSHSLQTCLGVLFPTGEDRPMAEMTPSFVLTTLWTSQLIGVLCARSLHYQFYSWFVFSIPYLLHKTNLPFPLQIVLWFLQELAWNIYPSTRWSSAAAVAVPAAIVIGVWIGTAKDVVGVVLTEEHYTKQNRKQARRALQVAQMRSGKN